MFYQSVVILLSIFGSVGAVNITIPYEFPLFGQCDEKWADDMMGNKTICDVGCLMSSTAMALVGCDIPIIDGERKDIVSTPKTLNQWLRHNDGYGM